MAVDVRQGLQHDAQNPPRLELEICGHGSEYRTWSILYKVIPGEIKKVNAGAWKDLAEWIKKTQLTFKREGEGVLQVAVTFIDRNSDTISDIVHQFTADKQNTYPALGFNLLKARKNESYDSRTFGELLRYRRIKDGEVWQYNISPVQINTNFYKRILGHHLNIERAKGDLQKLGFCDFPETYGERYFYPLQTNQKTTDNSPLTCRIYNLCAADIYRDDLAAMSTSKTVQPPLVKNEVYEEYSRLKIILEDCIRDNSWQKKRDMPEKIIEALFSNNFFIMSHKMYMDIQRRIKQDLRQGFPDFLQEIMEEVIVDEYAIRNR